MSAASSIASPETSHVGRSTSARHNRPAWFLCSKEPAKSELFGIIERLVECHEGVRCRQSDEAMIVETAARDSLTLTILKDDGRSTLAIGPCYNEIESDELLICLVRKALLRELRLRIERRNGRDRVWRIEVLAYDGAWREISSMSSVEFGQRGDTIVRYAYLARERACSA